MSEVGLIRPSHEERTADAAQYIDYQVESTENRAEHRRTQRHLRMHSARWAKKALRRTALAPGTRTSGFVYVPVDQRAYTLVLHVEGKSGVVTVPFR